MRRNTAVVLSILIAGCGGGSKILKKPLPVQVVQPLASTSDTHISATLEWIVIRDNPGTWAKNADWDEYLLRIKNNTDEPVSVESVVVFDSLGTRLEPERDRKALVKASKQTYKRYEKASTKVMAGRSGVGLFATGAAVTVVGTAAAVSAAYGSILAGGGGAGAAGAIGAGLVLAGPAIALGGIVRHANNRAVDEEIKRRQSELPTLVAPGEAPVLGLFFPIAPSPTHLEVSYVFRGVAHDLTLDLKEALLGIHLRSSEENEEKVDSRR